MTVTKPTMNTVRRYVMLWFFKEDQALAKIKQSPFIVCSTLIKTIKLEDSQEKPHEIHPQADISAPVFILPFPV